MFDIFSSKPIDHPQLGRLTRKDGRWRGTLTIAGLPAVNLSLPGDKSGPEPAAVAIALELPNRWPSLGPMIGGQMFEHYLPYREAVEAGEVPVDEGPVPNIADATLVWSEVIEAWAAIRPSTRKHDLLFGFSVTWDVEHTLGAVIDNWTLTELSGSIGQFEL